MRKVSKTVTSDLVVPRARRLADALTELLDGGMYLERRHYRRFQKMLYEHPELLVYDFMTAFLHRHKENLVRTLPENYCG